jgi:hypothetical protein
VDRAYRRQVLRGAHWEAQIVDALSDAKTFEHRARQVGAKTGRPKRTFSSLRLAGRNTKMFLNLKSTVHFQTNFGARFESCVLESSVTGGRFRVPGSALGHRRNDSY